MLHVNDATGAVHHSDGAVFDAWNWRWVADDMPDGARRVSAMEALRHIATDPASRRLPVGVIGPRDATERQLSTAESLGRELAALGLTVICGGRGGVMAAVSKGVRAGGGLSVGLLPGSDWREANDDIVLPIATGMSQARNVIIAKSCAALVAVGGAHGTLSEVAFGLHFDKLVIGLEGAPEVDGVVQCAGVADAMPQLAAFLLRRDGVP